MSSRKKKDRLVANTAGYPIESHVGNSGSLGMLTNFLILLESKPQKKENWMKTIFKEATN